MTERQWGFTLIELLVALAVIGLALSSLLVNVMGNLDAQVRLRDKTIANWVAVNQLELAQINNRYSELKPSRMDSGVETLAGRDWYWRLNAQPSGDYLFTRLEISVYDQASMQEAPLITLVGALSERAE